MQAFTSWDPDNVLRVASVIGGRPHPIKAATINGSLVASERFRHDVIDCGYLDKPYAHQNYVDLGLPQPAVRLREPSGARGSDEISALITAFIAAYDEVKPDHLLLYGDTDSSVVAAVAAAEAGVRFTHVEAGLRSYDYCDSEESNRLRLDELALFHVTHSIEAVENLRGEGRPSASVLLTGNPIVETLHRSLASARRSPLLPATLADGSYCLATLHRRESLADKRLCGTILDALGDIARSVPVVMLAYRSTMARIGDLIEERGSRITVLPTLPYLEYLSVLRGARLVVTDSSGLQDEARALGIPCITCRRSTHRHDTLGSGGNRLGRLDRRGIARMAFAALDEPYPLAVPLPSSWTRPVGADVVDFLGDRLPAAMAVT